MKNFKVVNNIIGWLMFLGATTVYALTVEPTASFWDCGEFIAVSYKLMVPHPPGAPFYLLIGRIFSMFALGNAYKVAFWVNMVSVICSGATILFLYWTIVLLAKKLVASNYTFQNIPLEKALLIIGAGIVGGLAYTFSDSFWFSAVEAEVYAMSSFFTAFVVWAMLKWELIKDEASANRWLILIFYMMGLSIGVHLLNLVTIPALALIYYFKKYPKPSLIGTVGAILVGLLIVGIINNFIIPGLPSIAGKFEIFFVNSLGLPFGSGIIFFLILFLGGISYGIYYSQIHQKVLLNQVLLAFTFVLIGYSSYALVLIRSNFDPPIDENDPENVISFVSYLKREQYGDRPLLYGHFFDAERIEVKQTEPLYRKGKDRYEIYDYKREVTYNPRRCTIFPRMYSQQEGHPDLYRKWVGLREKEEPTMLHNIKYLFIYQFGHIYFRYFLWNFAGRDGDDKDAGYLLPFETNHGVPEEIANNKARDNFYCLPLVLGLLGLMYQYNSDKRNFLMTILLFFLTGLALVLYLNSPPVEPRERDYIYVGSFYVFTIWIGFGVIQIAEWLSKVLRAKVLCAILSTCLAICVPIMMGAKSWDNHNRSNRYHSVDQARNTLASLAPNAVLFTGGDNDTFPLWYVQEVEGFRTDVRVVVLSYFSTDWYISQMRRKVYNSEPLPIGIDPVNYLQGTNDFVPLAREVDAPVNLVSYIDLVNKKDPRVIAKFQDGSSNAVLVSRRFFLKVDSAKVIEKGFIPKGKEHRVVSRLEFSLMPGTNYIYKSDLAILDILVHFNWDRPIYFNNTSANTCNIDLRQYLHLEGMAYRLMPIPTQNVSGEFGEVNTEVLKENLKKFQFRGFENPKVYHDEEYRKFAANELSIFYRLALDCFQKNNPEEAIYYLDEGLNKIPDFSIPYSYYVPRFVELYYLLGEQKKAKQISDKMGNRAIANLEYLSKPRRNNYEVVRQRSLFILNQLYSIYKNIVEMKKNQIQHQEMLEKLKQENKGISIPNEGDLQKLREEKEFFEKEFNKYSQAFSRFAQM
ncbi:MAG: DUF2723 domain-containing protein [Cytophagales bacterium]|nr:DUF2723 domain-containing protein [Cytophagales bacterium]MDW8384188.1 DUF2723 domain-containing protein [Flammeovirgaceae bacterium]